MSTPDQPPAPDTTPADRKARTAPPAAKFTGPADGPKAPAEPKAPVTDPEAPYGWMNDPSAPGGRRPKKRPGKQSTASTVEAPPNRGKPRKSRAGAAKGKDYTQPVTDLTNTVWMTLAAVPEVPFIPADVTLKLRAQAAVLDANQAGLINALALAGQNVPAIGKGIDAITGGAVSWVIPATLALLPFAAQSAALWRKPADELTAMQAKATGEKFGMLLAGLTGEAEAEIASMASAPADV